MLKATIPKFEAIRKFCDCVVCDVVKVRVADLIFWKRCVAVLQFENVRVATQIFTVLFFSHVTKLQVFYYFA